MAVAHTYSLGPVKTWVRTAAEEIGNEFDVGTVYGWRPIGSVPNSDHPKGLALDFMVYGNKAKGDQIAQYAISNADRLGITYVIWNRRIWQHGEWRAYTGPVPHTDHVHISFEASGGDPNAPATGGTVQPVGLDPSSWPVIKQIETFTGHLQDAAWLKRVGYYFLGSALIAVGLFFMLREPVGNAAVKAASVASKVV